MARRPPSSPNGHCEPIIYQYRSLMVDGPAQNIINGQSAQGWELLTVTSGGFDPFDGKWKPASTVLYFRKPWNIPKDPRVRETTSDIECSPQPEESDHGQEATEQ